jgi:chromosomal replication initiation ATPase DnaA
MAANHGGGCMLYIAGMSKRLRRALELAAEALDAPLDKVASTDKVRGSNVRTARCLAWWLTLSTSNETIYAIGNQFGITHPAVIFGVRSCTKLRKDNRKFRQLSDLLRSRLLAEFPSLVAAPTSGRPRTI